MAGIALWVNKRMYFYDTAAIDRADTNYDTMKLLILQIFATWSKRFVWSNIHSTKSMQ